KIADTDTPIPGSTENFHGFPVVVDIAPEISNGNVTFFDWGDSPLGIYSWDGHVISVVADENTIAPESSSSFTNPCCASIRGDRLFFSNTVDDIGALYDYVNGTFSKIVDSNATVPGETVTFESVGGFIGLIDNSPAFVGIHGPDIFNFTFGIFVGTSNSDIQKIVQEGDSAPGGSETFTNLRQELAAGGQHAYFLANQSNGVSGIYRGNVGNVEKIAISGDSIPGMSETFDGFNNFPSPVQLNGGAQGVVFGAVDSNFDSGIFRYADGSIVKLVDENSDFPVSPTANVTLAMFSASGENLVFRSFVNDDPVFSDILFIDVGNGIERLIGSGDQLDGKTVSAGLIGPNAMDGNEIVFVAAFEDFSQGVYVAHLEIANTIEPSPRQIPIPVFALLAASIAFVSVANMRRDFC
ncbi:MAG: hypothetical protein AAF387_15575, partial [Pseudomonadota bacterium]